MFQHRRRFFRRRAGLLSGAHFLPERGGGGWNPRHSFSTGCIVIGGTVCRAASLYRLLSCTQFRGAGVGIPAQFTAGGVVIGSTISVRCASRGKKMVVIGRTIRTFSAGGRLLSTAQFARWVKFGYCYRQHISEFRLLSKRIRTGLLSSAHFPAARLLSGAQFPNCRIWAAVVIDGTVLKNPPYSVQPVLLFTAQFVFSGAERLLSGAQFAKSAFFAARPAVGC